MRNKRNLLIVLVALVIVTAGFLSVQIPFESDPNPYALIPENDRLELEAFENSFGHGDPMMALVAENKNQWSNYSDFQLLNEMTHWWKDGDTTVAMSICNVPFPVQTIFGVKKKPFLDLSSEKRFSKWNSRADKFNDITSKFLSKNRKYALLFVPSKHYSLDKVHQFNSKFQTKNITLLPLDYNEIEAELHSTNQYETGLLALISLAIILTVFYLLTGSLKGLFFIFSMICLSLSLTAIFMFVSGIPFSVHMVAIPCMLIVLSFTDLMHLLHTHHKLRHKANSDSDLRKMLSKSLNRPMILTSLSNVIGFVLFLFLAKSKALRDISLVSITGVAFAFIASRFLAIQMLTKSASYFRKGTGEKWQGNYETFLHKIRPKRNGLLFFFTLLTGALIVLVAKNMTIDNVPYVMDGKSPSFKASKIISEHFFGDKTASVHIEFDKTEDLWSPKSMQHLEKVTNKIEQLFHPIGISSVVVVAKRFHRYQRNGHPGAFTLPGTYDKELINNAEKLGGGGVINLKDRKSRIQFSYKDLDLESSRLKMEQLNAFLIENPAPEGIRMKLHGRAYLNDKATYEFSTNIIWGLLLTIFFGALLTFIFVQNFHVFLATLVANSLPLIAALSIMHFTGSQLNPISLFFFTVIMGLCVDDSIYLILHRGENNAGSIYPIAITSAVLAVGFAAFLFSSYEWIRPFGWVFLVAIIIAFLFDALLLTLFIERNSIFDANV